MIDLERQFVNDKTFDIVIIGAGIAGLSCARAIALTKKDLSLAIIEGASIGSNNPSPLTFRDVVERYNLSDCLKSQHSSFTFHNFKGSKVSYLLAQEPLVLLDYKKACFKIFQELKTDVLNFSFINDYAAAFYQTGKEVHIKLKSGGEIITRLLIDASGKAQLGAKNLNISKAGYYSHVYGAFFSGVELPERPVCSYLLPDPQLGSGGGWFYSIEANTASFGYAQISDSNKTNRDELKRIFDTAMSEFQPYAEYLKNAKVEYIETGIIPISHVNKFVNENIVIIGDAAGMATNWTCMGIEPALRYGILAGEIAVKAITQDDFTFLNNFQIAWDKENKTVYDSNAKLVSKFWDSDYYFWEWIVKNDLAYLTPDQLIGRLRRNAHLLKKYQILTRALTYKIKTIINKKTLEPQDIIITK